MFSRRDGQIEHALSGRDFGPVKARKRSGQVQKLPRTVLVSPHYAQALAFFCFKEPLVQNSSRFRHKTTI